MSEVTRPRAIVCDVGHTIIHKSVLNHVLQQLGRTGTARLLYDRAVLSPERESEMEQWVDQVIREKVHAMQGVPVDTVCRLAVEVPLTPGFDELLSQAATNGVPVMLMGAVPAFITEALVAPYRSAIANIAGTEVATANGAVDRATWVCTPKAKAEAVRNWLQAIGVAAEATVVIGDSIGDLGAMALVPQANRVAFNADPDIVPLTGRAHRDAMYELTRELFA